jgi:hypothetical protein
MHSYGPRDKYGSKSTFDVRKSRLFEPEPHMFFFPERLNNIVERALDIQKYQLSKAKIFFKIWRLYQIKD